MKSRRKPVGWLHGEIRTPPFTPAARMEAGYLLGLLQEGHSLSLPHSRPMPDIAPRCHELRVKDARADWRIVYRIDPDAVLVLEVFGKTTRATPHEVIEKCRKRLRVYDAAAKG